VKLACKRQCEWRGSPADLHFMNAGAFDAVVCWHHARGGEGAVDLAKAIDKACQQPTQFRFLYPLDLSIKVCSTASGWSPHPATCRGVQSLTTEINC
jgi:hypothetical protein